MSDELKVYIDSSELNMGTEEDLVLVPREYWDEELKKILSSRVHNIEKMKAICRSASSMFTGGEIFAPRHSSQFEEMEGDVAFGLPFSVHGNSQEYDVETSAVGLFKESGVWYYASTLIKPSYTKFAITDKWFNDEDLGPFASIIFTEEGFKLLREPVDAIESFIVHRSIPRLSSVNLSEHAIAQTFDLGRPLSSYNKITFILTGNFISPSVNLPAVDSGHGFGRDSSVFIQLGTSDSPCFILGKGGNTGGNGGPALKISDVSASFSIVKGHPASLVAGGGGGGCSFKCFSMEAKSGFTVRGGGGVSGGTVDGVFSSQDSSKKKVSESSKSKKIIALPPNSKAQTGTIKKIENGEVEIFEDYHSLDSGDRVIISDVDIALDGTYFVESTAPQKFKLFNNAELDGDAVDITYAPAVAEVTDLNSRADLEGIAQKIYEGDSYALEVKTQGGVDMALKPLGYTDRIFITNLPDNQSELNDSYLVSTITETTSQDDGAVSWSIGEITGNFGSNQYVDPKPSAYFLNDFSAKWSFIGSQGFLESKTASLPGYKDIEISGNGGWYGEDGQKTKIGKIYDPSLHKSNPSAGFSENEQIGGLAGSSILSSTTNITGTDVNNDTPVANIKELNNQPWVLGEIKTFNNSSDVYTNRIFDQLKDNNNVRLQEEFATSMVKENLISNDPQLIGGVSFDADNNVIATSGIFSEQQ